MNGTGEARTLRSLARVVPRSDDGIVDVPMDRPGQRERDSLRLFRVGVVLAWSAVLMGAVVLVGYVIGSERIVELRPSLPPMYPNAALGLVAGGLAVHGSTRDRGFRVAAGLGAVVITAIGAVGLWLNLTDAGPTWYELLFPDDVVGTTPVGGRPVVETCVAFLFLGTALMAMVARRAPVMAQGFAVAATAVGASAVVGYLLGVDRRGLGLSVVYVGMALHTALGIAVLGAAAILIRPGVGLMAQLLDGGLSGAITRRLTIGIAGAPVLLIVAGVVLSAVAPTEELAQSVFSVLQVGVLGVLVLVPSAVIVRTERELRNELDQARRRVESGTDLDVVVEAVASELGVFRPDVRGWETGMRHEPAWGHLAGDSIQVLTSDGPRPSSLLAVFDMTGHGAESAVLAYGLRTHIAALWERGADLAEIADSTNAKLLRRRTNATAVLLRLQEDPALVDVLNAGHPPPMTIRAGRVAAWPRTGPLFGLPSARYEVRSEPVDRGELIVICTDGLFEARAPDGELLGEERLNEVVLRHQHEPVQAVADACVDLALEHSQGRLRDDALVVVLRRSPHGTRPGSP